LGEITERAGFPTDVFVPGVRLKRGRPTAVSGRGIDLGSTAALGWPHVMRTPALVVL